MFLVPTKKGAMGTQFGAVVDADNFDFLLVVGAELNLVGVGACARNGVPR